LRFSRSQFHGLLRFLDSREFSTTYEFEGATIKVDCVAFSRLDISEDVDEIKLRLVNPQIAATACRTPFDLHLSNPVTI